jgi:hypothetical protein
VSFAAITLGVASQRVFIVIVVYFIIDSVRKLLDTPSYICTHLRLSSCGKKKRLNLPFFLIFITKNTLIVSLNR